MIISEPFTETLNDFVLEKPIWRGSVFLECSLASSQLNHTVKSLTSRGRHKLGIPFVALYLLLDPGGMGLETEKEQKSR